MNRNLIKLKYSFFYRYYKERILKILVLIFTAIGAAWTLIECFTWLFEGTPYPGKLRSFIKEHFVAEGTIIVLCSFFIKRRKLRIKKTFANTDLTVVVEFCDLFKQEGAIIIPVMDTFDNNTTNGLVNQKSIHGQFIEKFYKNNVPSLDNEISNKLASLGKTPVQHNIGLIGKADRYEIGTTCPISTHGQYFYLTALTYMKDTGNVDMQPQYIYDFLSSIWNFIPNYGEYHETVNIPVIGTGLSRLPASYTNQFILGEITNSFFVFSKKVQTCCKTLKICLHIKDYKYYDFDEIEILFTHIDTYLNR